MDHRRIVKFVFIFILYSLQVYLTEAIRFRARFIRTRVRFSNGYTYYEDESQLSVGAIIGIVIGSIVGAGLLIFLCCCCCVMICGSSKESGEVIQKEQSTIPAISNTQMSGINHDVNGTSNQQQPVMAYPYGQPQTYDAKYSAPPPGYAEANNYGFQPNEKDHQT